MSTPLADRIRKKAQETAAKPITPTGAVGAMAKQAEVSSTGKAAAPGAGLAQSNVQEASVAAQGQTSQDAIAQEVQQSGEQMAVTEKQSDAKQAGVESQQAQRKLAADNEFNNALSKFASRVKMSGDKKEQEMAAFELKSQLLNQRLNNDKYMEALESAGRNKRLKSKEDFSIAMSEQGLTRGKAAGDELRANKQYIQDFQRDKHAKISRAEMEAAFNKSKSDIKSGWKADVTDHMTGGLSSGDSSNAAGMMSKFGSGGKKAAADTETDPTRDGGDPSGPKDRHRGQ